MNERHRITVIPKFACIFGIQTPTINCPPIEHRIVSKLVSLQHMQWILALNQYHGAANGRLDTALVVKKSMADHLRAMKPYTAADLLKFFALYVL